MNKSVATEFDTDEQSATFGQPKLIGKKVKFEGSVGVVDRVDITTGDIFVWFGEITKIGEMKVTQTCPFDKCELVD